MTETTGGDQIETEVQAQQQGLTRAQIWLKKIERAQADEKAWHEEAEIAVSVYEGDEKTSVGKTSFNIFHSNIETLLPALYNSTPVPDVRRRYGDADPVAKTVVDLCERNLSYLVDQYDFDETMRDVVRDALVPGRGVARVRYEPSFTTQIDPMTGQPVEVKAYETITCERVPYDRFVRGPGKRWEDVPWVAFKHDLTRDELVQLAGEAGAALEVKSEDRDKAKDDNDDDKGIFRTACVWEIWDKDTKSVLFVAADEKKLVKVEPDPLGLKHFFPVPRPLQQIKRVSSLTPVSAYSIYRPLIEELDSITKRIRKLVAQLKVRGIVAAAISQDAESLRSAEDGQYITANDAASFVGGGGSLDNAVTHWPLDPTVKALQQLYVQRDAIKATIYEVTGLSDILRGASEASETATAQQIKSQWGSLRIQNLQREVQRLARDLFRMKAELMANHYEPQNLILAANMGQEQTIGPAIQLFKSQLATFRIDIETDSTVRADMTRNQEQMNMFLAGSGQFVQGMMGAAQMMPQLLPAMVEVYTAFARNFSLGKQAEDALDQLSSQAPMMAEAASQPQEDPAEKQAQVEQQKAEMQMGMAREKHGLEMQKLGAQVQADTIRNQNRMQADQMRAQTRPANGGLV